MTTHINTVKKMKIPPIVWIVLGLAFFWNIPKIYSRILPEDPRSGEGNVLMISEGATDSKKQGIESYKRGNFQEAKENFQASLTQNRNDPETLIYLDNSLAKDHNPLKLAVVVPLGSNINIAQEMLRGVAQAQNEINQKGGINNRYIHITIVNDDNEPKIAEEVAQKIVKNPEIMGVIGHNASNASLAAAPIYQKGGLVMVNPTSFANGLSGIGNYVFRTTPNINLMAKPLAEYATNHSKKVAICYDSQALDGISFKDEFVAALVNQGGKLAATVCDFSLPSFDAHQAIADAVNSGADSLLLLPHIDRTEKAYELARQNQGKLQLLANSTLNTMKTLELGQPVQGLSIAVPWSSKNPANRPFAESARQLWGGDVTWRTAGAYDATNAIIAGLNVGQTRDTLQKAIKSPQFMAKSINGEVKFLANGDRAGKAVILQVKPSPSHATGYDFVPIAP